MAESNITIEVSPAFVDPALIWKKGTGLGAPVPTIVPSRIVTVGIKPLILDIETTGSEPWADRIICIGVKDPFQPLMDPIVFINEDEEKVVIQFLNYFKAGGYNQLVAYNTAFDYRFIFAKMLYYRIAGREYCDAKLYDIMQVMEQVKQSFVYGYNKSGKLGDWTSYLFGLEKPLTFQALLVAWENRDYATITSYNKFDVQQEFILYALIELVTEQNYTGQSFAMPEGSGETTTLGQAQTSIPTTSTGQKQTWNARCPNCYSVFEVPIDVMEYICPIDGTKIMQGG